MSKNISDILAETTGQIRARHHKELSDFAARRFLTGLAQELQSHPKIDGFWANFGIHGSVFWVRPQKSEYDDEATRTVAPPREPVAQQSAPR